MFFRVIQNATSEVPEAKDDMKKVRQFLIETIQLDSERVYDNDIKKLMKCIEKKSTDFFSIFSSIDHLE